MKKMSKLLKSSIGLLQKMHDDKTCLFSYSALQTDGKHINNFENKGRYRYTLNVLLGLQKLEQYFKTSWDLRRIIDTFLSDDMLANLSLGDKGLLLNILSLENHNAASQILTSINDALIHKSSALKHSVQDISWASIGITTYAEKSGDGKTLNLARKVNDYLHQDLMNSYTLLPKHSCGPRGAFVSFGGIAYFLMAIEHYARAFDDAAKTILFKKAVARVMRLQGDNGEWPWFIDSSSGNIMDWYQLYSVHQDSMAMLFLLPAMVLGVKGSESAIRKSFSFLFGDNQLRKPLIQTEPFFIFRSIRRKNEIAERPCRLLRSIGNKIFNKCSSLADSRSLEINKECRSYHLGWILYAWAGRNDFAEFTELELFPS